jgi:hypothetical protein
MFLCAPPRILLNEPPKQTPKLMLRFNGGAQGDMWAPLPHFHLGSDNVGFEPATKRASRPRPHRRRRTPPFPLPAARRAAPASAAGQTVRS